MADEKVGELMAQIGLISRRERESESREGVIERALA